MKILICPIRKQTKMNNKKTHEEIILDKINNKKTVEEKMPIEIDNLNSE